MATGYEKPITVKTVISATARFHSSSLLSHTYLKCVCVKHSRSVELTSPRLLLCITFKFKPNELRIDSSTIKTCESEVSEDEDVSVS